MESTAAQKQMAEHAFSLLTLRPDTPPGEWVDEHRDPRYAAVREQARALAGERAEDDVLLSVLNLADVLPRYLVAATGIDHDAWLARVHDETSPPIDRDRTGVRGPRQPAL
jgi:hypothetical protein